MEGKPRRKQPEVVRRALLDETARLASVEGLGAVTVDAVAKAAGVTKGGLFHHFPNKQALVDALVAEMIAELDERIDARMADAPEVHGAFTRAYVEAVLDDLDLASSSPWAPIAISLQDPSVRKGWSDWLGGRLERHHKTDSGTALAMVRLAADGAWYASVLGFDPGHGDDVDGLKERLLALTQAG